MARAPSAEDDRAVEVFLTSKGTELFERLHARLREALAPRIDRLNASDQQRLQELLRRMLDSTES